MGTAFSDSEYSEPLLKAATPDLYKDNSFRIIGLPTNASPANIKRTFDRAEMLIKLSSANVWQPDGLMSLKEPIGAEKLLEAKRRLKDPEYRLVDECFWFWHGDQDEAALDTLSHPDIWAAAGVWESHSGSVIARHNLAVLYHSLALDREGLLESEATEQVAIVQDDLWNKALTLWRNLNSSDDFWQYLTMRAREINDPRLDEDALKRFRRTFPAAILRINSRLFLLSTENPDAINDGPKHIKRIAASRFPADAVSESLRLSARMVEEHVRALCRQVETEGASNPRHAGMSVRKLLETTKQLLPVFNCLKEDEGDIRAGVVRDDMAQCALNCLITFGNESRNWVAEQELLEMLLPEVASEPVASKIREEINAISANVQAQRAERERAKRRELQMYVESFTTKIDVIVSSRASAQARFYQLRDRLVTDLALVNGEKGETSYAFNEISNVLARVLMNVAVELSKEGGKVLLAREAIDLAAATCRDEELKRLIEQNIKIIDISLYTTPIRTLCEKAKVNALSSPDRADEVVRWLLVNTEAPLAQVDSIYDEQNPTRIAIHDEVALTALECHHHFGRKTMNMAVCLELLELIRPVAVRESTRGRITEELDFVRRYLAAQTAKDEGTTTSEQNSETTREDQQKDNQPHTSNANRPGAYSVHYSEGDILKSLASEIRSIVDAPEPPTQKFYELLDHVLPIVRKISNAEGSGSDLAKSAADMAARALRGVGGELYRSTETRGLGQEALSWASRTCADPNLKSEIEREKIELSRYAAEMEALMQGLGPVKDAGRVRTYVGTGTALRGQSDYDSKHLSHLATLYLVLIFIPVIPLGRYRVMQRIDGTYRFLGRTVLRTIDRLHLGAAIVILIALIFALLLYLAA